MPMSECTNRINEFQHLKTAGNFAEGFEKCRGFFSTEAELKEHRLGKEGNEFGNHLTQHFFKRLFLACTTPLFTYKFWIR